MAYIRMVRSGGLHYVSNAINFLPEISDVLNLEDMVRKDRLSAETAQAARYARRRGRICTALCTC